MNSHIIRAFEAKHNIRLLDYRREHNKITGGAKRKLEDYPNIHKGMVLKGYTSRNNKIKFSTFHEAVDALKLDEEGAGITRNSLGIFTIRKGSVLKPSAREDSWLRADITAYAGRSQKIQKRASTPDGLRLIANAAAINTQTDTQTNMTNTPEQLRDLFDVSDSDLSSDSDSDESDDCPKGSDEKYRRRKGPPRPASHVNCQGQIRVGNDKMAYKSVKIYSSKHKEWEWKWKRVDEIERILRAKKEKDDKKEQQRVERERQVMKRAKEREMMKEKKRLIQEEQKRQREEKRELEKQAKLEKKRLEKEARELKKTREREEKQAKRLLEQQQRDNDREKKRVEMVLKKIDGIREKIIGDGAEWRQKYLPVTATVDVYDRADMNLAAHVAANKNVRDAIDRVSQLNPRSSMEKLTPSPHFSLILDDIRNGTLALHTLGLSIDPVAFLAINDRKKQILALLNAHRDFQKRVWKAATDGEKQDARDRFSTQFREYCMAHKHLYDEYPDMPTESDSGNTDNDLRRDVLETFAMDIVNDSFTTELDWNDIIGEKKYCAKTVRRMGKEHKEWQTNNDEYVSCAADNECGDGYACESTGLRQDYEKFIFNPILNKPTFRPYWFTTPPEEESGGDEDEEEENVEALKRMAVQKQEGLMNELRTNVFNRLNDELRTYEVSPYVGVLVAGELDENAGDAANPHSVSNMHRFGKGYYTYGYVTGQNEDESYNMSYIAKRIRKEESGNKMIWAPFPWNEVNVPEEVIKVMVKDAYAEPLLTVQTVDISQGQEDRPSFEEFASEGFQYFFTTFFPRFNYQSLHYNTNENIHNGLPLWPLMLMEEEERKLMMRRFREDDGANASPFMPEDMKVIKQVHLRIVRPIIDVHWGTPQENHVLDRWNPLCDAFMAAIDDPDAIHPRRRQIMIDLDNLDQMKQRNELTATAKKRMQDLILELRTVPNFHNEKANEAVQYFEAAYQFALKTVADDVNRLSTFFYIDKKMDVDEKLIDIDKKKDVDEKLIVVVNEAPQMDENNNVVLASKRVKELHVDLSKNIHGKNGMYLIYEGGSNNQMLRNCPWPNSFTGYDDIAEDEGRYYREVRQDMIRHYLNMKVSEDNAGTGESLSGNDSDNELSDEGGVPAFTETDNRYGKVIVHNGNDMVVFNDGTQVPKDPQYHNDIIEWFNGRLPNDDTSEPSLTPGEFKRFLVWYYAGDVAGAEERTNEILSFYNNDTNKLLDIVEETNKTSLTFPALYRALNTVKMIAADAEATQMQEQMKEQMKVHKQQTELAQMAVQEYTNNRPKEVIADREEIRTDPRLGNEYLLDDNQLRQIATLFIRERKGTLKMVRTITVPRIREDVFTYNFTPDDATMLIFKIVLNNMADNKEELDDVQKEQTLKYIRETVNHFDTEKWVSFPVDIVGFLEVYERYDHIVNFEDIEQQEM